MNNRPVCISTKIRETASSGYTADVNYELCFDTNDDNRLNNNVSAQAGVELKKGEESLPGSKLGIVAQSNVKAVRGIFANNGFNYDNFVAKQDEWEGQAIEIAEALTKAFADGGMTKGSVVWTSTLLTAFDTKASWLAIQVAGRLINAYLPGASVTVKESSKEVDYSFNEAIESTLLRLIDNRLAEKDASVQKSVLKTLEGILKMGPEPAIRRRVVELMRVVGGEDALHADAVVRSLIVAFDNEKVLLAKAAQAAKKNNARFVPDYTVAVAIVDALGEQKLSRGAMNVVKAILNGKTVRTPEGLGVFMIACQAVAAIGGKEAEPFLKAIKEDVKRLSGHLSAVTGALNALRSESEEFRDAAYHGANIVYGAGGGGGGGSEEAAPVLETKWP